MEVDETKDDGQDGDVDGKGIRKETDKPKWGGGSTIYSSDPKIQRSMEEQVAKQNHRKKRRRIAEESFEAQEGYKARLKGILVSMTDYISKEESKVSKTAAAHLRKGRGKGGRLKWWTEELEKRKKEVRKRRREWQREKRRGGENEDDLRRRYMQEMREYRNRMSERKKEEWCEYVREEGNKNPWGGVDKIVRGKRRRQGVASIRMEGGFTRTWRESAQCLLDKFFPRDGNGDDWRMELSDMGGVNELVEQFEEEEIEDAIRKMKRNKAPGWMDLGMNG
ncbi:unnamed protein product [Trichogramma brassicae]|uniref:Uncharacterized protein n=1 Tax=Trichogramma brassicae TaxID=86971 RepID=A0A6H5J278_9HYME|nr:unnamed protein product [Trichogramma brassicae]